MRTTAILALGLLSSLCVARGANAQDGVSGVGIPSLDTTRVTSGLTLPVGAYHAPGDFSRLFIVEQRSGTIGRIRILNLPANTLNATPYLSISPVSTGSEQGLLGLAFHPDFLNNGYFYVYYTNPNTQVVRFRANAPYDTSTTAVATGTGILTISQPETNHNGGWIGFGPDGYLYIATGDGGGANDQHSNASCTSGGYAQCINILLGKMLRIDIDGADNIPANDDDDGDLGDGSTNGYTSPATNPYAGATPGMDEIWHIGLRNPWRCSFDRVTGDLYIGDVGQNAREEVSFQPANASSGGPGTPGYEGGRNYGWRCMEGFNCTGLTGCTCNSPTLTLPIHTYNWFAGAAVAGGYVYRGSAIPELQGTYFFADYGNSQISTFSYSGSGSITNLMNRTAELAPGGGLSISSPASFGEDAAGELYICDRSGGEVFKVIPSIPPAPTNDNCASATLVPDGSTNFSTVSATTDGPDEVASCDFNGDTNIARDVWFKYVAACTGDVTVDLCGSAFNTKMAVYVACPAGPGELLACNDDTCGDDAQITFSAVEGELYRFRVGGFMASTGTGTITVTCTPTPGCVGDVDNSGGVNVDDLLSVINAWGDCKGCPADVDNNGVVNVDDLLLVINGWGDCL